MHSGANSVFLRFISKFLTAELTDSRVGVGCGAQQTSTPTFLDTLRLISTINLEILRIECVSNSHQLKGVDVPHCYKFSRPG